MSNIYLIGFMGAGKSYLGKKLAQTLGRPFADLDTWIESTKGQSIKEIFEQQGEQAFRQLEADHLRKSKHHQHLIVATGGGTPCHHDGMKWMRQNGQVIFLDPPVDILISRLENARAHRPLVAEDMDFRRSITERLAERRPTYEKAHLTIRQYNDEQEVVRLIKESLQL